MYGKILIQFQLKVLAGVHIGGNDAFSAIGAVDKPVIRDPLTNEPILPGSSVKGKLRTHCSRAAFARTLQKCRTSQRMPMSSSACSAAQGARRAYTLACSSATLLCVTRANFAPSASRK